MLHCAKSTERILLLEFVVTRLYMAPHTKKNSVNENFKGTLFLPGDDRPYPGKHCEMDHCKIEIRISEARLEKQEHFINYHIRTMVFAFLIAINLLLISLV